MKFVSKRSRIVAALENGEKFTAKQITVRFKSINPKAMIEDIRRYDKLNVVKTTVKAKNGVSYKKYMLSTTV
jgi:hypothetical protein